MFERNQYLREGKGCLLYTSKVVGANLIQAQRDYFGAHTYKRIDREGTFHHQWQKHFDR